MHSFPAFFPLAGRTVAIAGDGEAADAKARLFEGSPATVVRLAAPAAFDPAAYRGVVLAFVADADARFAEAAAKAARAAGAPVNVTDRPALCDFISPAVIDRGEVVAAVSASGAAPMLAAMLRNDIEARIPPDAGRTAALLREFQDDIRRALPRADDRRAFLRDLLDGLLAEAGDLDEARRRISDALSKVRPGEGWRRVGRVSVILRPGAVDLLSLRAARMLSHADALVMATEDAAVAGLVRRDARRIAPGDAAIASVLALVAEGLHVAWVADGAVPGDLATALNRAGVALSVLAPGSA